MERNLGPQDSTGSQCRHPIAHDPRIMARVDSSGLWWTDSAVSLSPATADTDAHHRSQPGVVALQSDRSTLGSRKRGESSDSRSNRPQTSLSWNAAPHWLLGWESWALNRATGLEGPGLGGEKARIRRDLDRQPPPCNHLTLASSTFWRLEVRDAQLNRSGLSISSSRKDISPWAHEVRRKCRSRR